MEDKLQIIIWGAGKNLENNIHRICLDDICCLIDSNTEKQKHKVYGIDVYAPEKLAELEYDYVIVSSELYFDEIARLLLFKYGVECRKILHWKGFLQEERSVKNALRNSAKSVCSNYGIHEALDIGGILQRSSYWNIEHEPNLDLILLKNDIYGFVERRYRKVYRDVYNLPNVYDLIISESDDAAQKWGKTFWKSRHTILPLNRQGSPNSNVNLKGNADVFNIHGVHMIGICNKKKDIKIYQVTHKKFKPVNGELYKPIHAGRQGKADLGYLGDAEGDNISALNDKINECTALYWIWKNDRTEYVGLNHYRRLFRSAVNGEWMLQDFEVQILLEQYDIIVALAYDTGKLSVLESMRYQVCQEALDNAYDVLQDIFQKRKKEDYEAFRYVMNGYMLYPCNMFITSRKIMEEYCEWLFPIIFEMVEKVEIKDTWDDYSKRILGFFAERLLTVWIVQHNFRIKELPILLLNQTE